MANIQPIRRELDSSISLIEQAKLRLSKYLKGKTEIIDLSLATFLAGGHLLLEGPPGTGKTSLAKSMATVFGGSFSRIQMTSDLLPSDIVGLLRLQPGGTEFEFRKGPIFSHFLLADELNRTSPKTQSALLEAMAEGTVSVDGKTYRLPQPFFVIGTQNPAEFQGVYPLAESQLDRFMARLILDSPGREDELSIYIDRTQSSQVLLEPLFTTQTAQEFRLLAQNVHVEASVLAYATDLVRATRDRTDILSGVSIRGGLQFISAARGLALVRGRNFVVPKDLIDLAGPALAHRICFSQGDPGPQKRIEVIHEILDRIQAPK